jgi:hypothetical protein
MMASINLAAMLSTKSLLTCKSATVFDVHLISKDERHPLRRGWNPGERRGKSEGEKSIPMGVCAIANDWWNGWATGCRSGTHASSVPLVQNT